MGSVAAPALHRDRKDIGPTFLRILATSDLHVQLYPWDYHADTASPGRGLARTAGLIATARAEARCSVLLDNGDFLQGSPMGDMVAQGHPGTAPHPMIAAMNHLRYDAATLGNHEFSHGLPFLMGCLRDAAFPVISANIARSLGTTPDQDRHFVQPYVLLDRTLADADGKVHPLRIGVIGFAPPQTVQWDYQQIQGAIQTRDIFESASATVPVLRALGAHIVIALSHSGIGATAASAGMENATAALAALPGIDALVGGHTHQFFPSADFHSGGSIDATAGTLSGKPAVMPGFYGSHLGVIDLALTHGNGCWQVSGHHAELRPIAFRNSAGKMQALVQSDAGVETLAAAAHQAARVWSNRPIGRNSRDLHSYFALVTACPCVQLVAQAQASHVAKALESTPFAGFPVISAAAPFRAGGRGGPENYTFVPKGVLVTRHVADLYFHPNNIAALLVSGAELQDWLERSAGIFQTITPGAQDAALIDPDFPSFNFEMLDGLSYRIDLSQPARFDRRGGVLNPTAQRITDLRHDGRPLHPKAQFVLATNSYRTGGSGAFAGARPDRVILSGPHSSRDIVQAHLTALGTVPSSGPANWSFVPLPGTSVVFDSAPAAADHLPDLPADLSAEPLELTPHGFRRFRLHL